MILFLSVSVNWYGMYVKGTKVGYSQVTRVESPTGYKLSELMHLELSVMGMTRWFKSIAQYEVTSDYELNSLTFDLETEAQKILIRGEMTYPEKGLGCSRQSPKLDLSIKTGGTDQPKTIEAKGKVYPITALPMIASGFTSSGKEIEIFDPSIQAINTAACKLIESQTDSIQVEAIILGAKSTLWVSKDGTLLSSQQPMDIVMRKESKEEALQADELVPEIMSLYGIQPEVKVRNPRDVVFMRLLVKGDIPRGKRQLRFGDTLLLQTIGPRMGKKMNKYLEPTPFIQCEDERIVKLASEIVGQHGDPWKQSRELVKWVAENVKDMPTVSMPSALDVLQTLEGDCGEHTVLFVALARACGIPAQMVVGLTYVVDGFYYHAWAKIWAGRWVEVDPTFGQPIADATHIALAEGGLGEQAKIMKLVDEIEIEILEYK
jgi:hypothetical protein